jgi:hypothetical protein
MTIQDALNTYPDVPRSVILKIECLRRGVKLTPAALAVLREHDDLVFKAFHLFSYDNTRTLTESDKVPHDFLLKDDTIIQIRYNDDSPFSLDSHNGSFYLCENGAHIEEISFRKVPKYYSQQFEDGTTYSSIVQAVTNCLLFLTVNKYCEMWKDNNQCLFCDFNATTVEQIKSGEKVVVHKSSEMVRKVLEEAMKEGAFHHLLITGGTVLTQVHSLNEIGYYCGFLEPMKEQLLQLGTQGHLQMNAREKEDIKRLKETGIGCLHMNMEVWDERLFKWICPGKELVVGYHEWIRRMIEAVDVFGRGNILCNFVTGVEMAKPHGFKDVKSALNSTLGGFDFLMKNGVLPRMDTWAIEGNSALAGQLPPPLEFYVRLEQGYFELRHKHNMPHFWSACQTCVHHDASPDWEYWYGEKEAAPSLT